MNLCELMQILTGWKTRHPNDDPAITVETQNGGMCGKFGASVKSITPGSDWTKGTMIIRTEEPVVVVRNLSNKRPRDFARERLDALKEAYAKLGQNYIAKCREEEWIDGFLDGINQHITACSNDDEVKRLRSIIDNVINNRIPFADRYMQAAADSVVDDLREALKL